MQVLGEVGGQRRSRPLLLLTPQGIGAAVLGPGPSGNDPRRLLVGLLLVVVQQLHLQLAGPFQPREVGAGQVQGHVPPDQAIPEPMGRLGLLQLGEILPQHGHHPVPLQLQEHQPVPPDGRPLVQLPLGPQNAGTNLADCPPQLGDHTAQYDLPQERETDMRGTGLSDVELKPPVLPLLNVRPHVLDDGRSGRRPRVREGVNDGGPLLGSSEATYEVCMDRKRRPALEQPQRKWPVQGLLPSPVGM
mmetsp:Transcript_137227/g.238636  ORF Transcript_137227/g.238636 Transcript_137227/m.238636 type:complete len:246 (+) Transcript_137227:1055-1792(+)